MVENPRPHLVGCCGSDCTAVWSAGQRQSSCEFTLCNRSRAGRSAVAQRHRTNPRREPTSAGQACWAALKHIQIQQVRLPDDNRSGVQSVMPGVPTRLTDWKSSSSSDMPSNMKPPGRKNSRKEYVAERLYHQYRLEMPGGELCWLTWHLTVRAGRAGGAGTGLSRHASCN